MRHISMIAALALAAMAACAPAPRPLPAVAPAVAAGPADPEFEAALNAVRAANGLGPARHDPRLAAAALGHAQDMAANGFTAHRGSDGRNHVQRIRAQGYVSCYPVENLAWDWSSPTRAAQEWARSPKHFENMTLPGDVDYGLGQAGRIYVLVLARRC